MATTRDLGQVEPWQESLERSRVRRQRAAAQDPGRRGRRTAAPSLRGRGPRTTARDAHGRRRPAASFAMLQAGAIVALLVLAVTLPSVFGGRSAQASATASSFPIPPRTPHADVGIISAEPVALSDVCRPAVGSAGYVNPLASARVTPERIDQGVDYAGSGTLRAIGAGTITNVVTGGTGWPGAFIEYQLLGGVDAGCYVYYAEGVTPVRGLHVRQSIHAGQAIATLIPHWSTGIEIGWGAGSDTKTFAALLDEWNAAHDTDNDPTAAGRSFSALIAALGGPPGRLEGEAGSPGSEAVSSGR